MQQAQKEGSLARVPPLQRFIFVMSSVAMPSANARSFMAAPNASATSWSGRSCQCPWANVMAAHTCSTVRPAARTGETPEDVRD